MKQFRLLATLLVVALCTTTVFTSCRNDDDDTTYTFIYSVDDVAGLIVDVTLLEYNDNEVIVGQHTIDNLRSGFRQNFTANSRATKVKVRFNWRVGTTNTVRWVQQVFYLEAGRNINIEITGNTLVGPSEPRPRITFGNDNVSSNAIVELIKSVKP